MQTEPNIHGEAVRYFNERAPILFFTLSKKGLIVDANAYAIKLTDRKLIGDPFEEVIVDFYGSFDLQAFANDSHQERLIHISAGTKLPQSFYFTFRQVSDHILAFGRPDADGIEQMQVEILSLNKELSNLTRELHKKNAQLKRLNEEKNRFLGMAAHDLRKPIGIILSYSGFLIEDLESLLDEEQNSFFNTIQTSCSFMKQLVDDFLDVSAIEAGKFDLDLSPIDLDLFLPLCLRFNTLQAQKKGIKLVVHSDDSLPRIAMDAPKIQQAITNLVSNAIEHSQAHSIVSISLFKKDHAIIFSVHDSGPGIAPEEISRLFTPYGNINTKKTAGEKSTGLGLLITRKIVESHGGKIWIDSNVGRGSNIYFNLPLAVEKK
jgi:signal transduction histidine kinase